jgi:hypothetical protein
VREEEAHQEAAQSQRPEENRAMSQALKILASAVLAMMVVSPVAAPASADFGLNGFDVTYTSKDGSMATQAGSHPYKMTTAFEINTAETPEGSFPVESTKDILVSLAPGFAGDQTTTPRCATFDFLTSQPPLKPGGDNTPKCPDASAVGIAKIELGETKKEAEEGGYNARPLYNLQPSPGYAARLGFIVLSVPVTIDIGVSKSPPYNLTANATNISQAVEVFGAKLEVWGVPTAAAHDEERGRCFEGGNSCPAGTPPKPFLTLPRTCTGPLPTSYIVDSWQRPGIFTGETVFSHDEAAPANPLGLSGCAKLGFGPQVSAQLGSHSADASSGLVFDIDVEDEGLKNPEGIAQADISKVKLTLPEGVTVNPSAAEGLSVCTLAQYEAESLKAPVGEGCPEASKLGTIEAETPLLEEHPLHGALYLAAQGENPFHTLIALYLVIRDPGLGIFIKLAGKSEPDPSTGQLISTFEDIPPYPLSHVVLTMREGPRAPLVTPPTCGTYTANTELTPSSGAAPLNVSSSFQVSSGVGGVACPSAGTPSFDPGFEAGALNNNAASFSSFGMRLTRRDGDQDLTRFSATLPPGMVAKLAGVTRCPNAAIAQAKVKTGRQELASASCPVSSGIGELKAGAGVGSILTYVPGKIYLAGPYNGAPLSVVAVVPAVAGPFDVGTVVTRVALQINPRTAEVRVDGAGSDPIPHILAGIPLRVRDIRVEVDRPQFTLNPTSCDPSAVAAQIWGGGRDVFSSADDSSVLRSQRYQAANCLNLGFKPKLDLKLKGGTKRGGHPGLTATYTPRPGDANVKGLVVRLPRSAFLDQAHIRTICTRVQFAAKACPKGAQYGFIKAWTPLLDEPLEGPVYLRSSSHKLPDLVFDLHGLVDVEVATRIDSSHGGIRATVEDAPDAPLSKVLLNMQGQKKGLIINSRDLCGATSKANVEFTGHNGKVLSAKPVMRAECGGGRKGKRASGNVPGQWPR